MGQMLLSHRLHKLVSRRRFVIKKAAVSSPSAELLLRQWRPVGELHSLFCMSASHRLFYLAELNPSPCIVNSTLFAHQICKKFQVVCSALVNINTHMQISLAPALHWCVVSVGALLCKQNARSLQKFKGAWLRFKSEIQQSACVN